MEICILFNATWMDFKLEMKDKFKKYKDKHYLFDFFLVFQFEIKGTVNVISAEPPYKDGYDLFSAVALKALSDQV